jgi:hypothetical protein
VDPVALGYSVAQRVTVICQKPTPYAQHHDEQGRDTTGFPAMAQRMNYRLNFETPWWASVGVALKSQPTAWRALVCWE